MTAFRPDLGDPTVAGDGSGILAPLGHSLDTCITGDGLGATPEEPCTNGRGIGRVYGVEVSPDGQTLYATSGDNSTVAVLGLVPATGKMTQLSGTAGCLATSGSSPSTEVTGCTRLRSFVAPLGVAVSPDSASLYSTTTSGARSVLVARRQAPPVCSAFRAATAFQTPVGIDFSCSDPNGDRLTRRILQPPSAGTIGVLPSGDRGVYTPNARVYGQDRFTYDATDGSLASAPVEVNVDIAPPIPPTPAPADVTPDVPGPECTVLNKAKPKTANVKKSGLVIKVVCKERAELALTATMSRSAGRQLGLRSRRANTIAVDDAAGLPGRTASVAMMPSSSLRKRLAKLSTKALKTFRITIGITAKATAGSDKSQRLSYVMSFKR